MKQNASIYKKLLLSVFLSLVTLSTLLNAQVTEEDSVFMGSVWGPDNGDGTYTNPILYADYSDPDIVRDGDDFYMVASSFNCVPGLPVLHSNDLVNWTIINHVFEQKPPYDVFATPGHGNGVWAPSIRLHNGTFYVFYGDPDQGVYMGRTDDPYETWEHKKVYRENAQLDTGWIDVCPFWDDNGDAYIVHAWAKSRCGFKSILTLRKMSEYGDTVYAGPEDSIMVINGDPDGDTPLETIEGPKMYKRNGYYYIFAPYNGVSDGNQVVLRSDTLIGPWEYKTVLEQGSTNINGPHQGGWVELESGECWFMHFQEVVPYGRIVHLQPMVWGDDNWPVLGNDGEPVSTYTKPDVGATYPIENPQTSDKFNSDTLGLQWQWHSNFESSWYSLSDNSGYMRLNAVELPESYTNAWDVGSMLLQKLPARKFSATTKVNLSINEGETTGMITMGKEYVKIEVSCNDTTFIIRSKKCADADGGSKEGILKTAYSKDSVLYLRMMYYPSSKVISSYSTDGITYQFLSSSTSVDEGKWIGAKIGLYCQKAYDNGTNGFADFDWFNVDYYFNQPAYAANTPYPADGDNISLTENSVKLNWEYDKTMVDSFYIYLSTDGAFTNPVSISKKANYTASDLVEGQTYYWRVDTKNDVAITQGPAWSFTYDGITGIQEKTSEKEGIVSIVPNPVTESAVLNFNLEKSSKIQLDIYDCNGRLIKTVSNKRHAAGTNSININVADLPAGIYMLRLQTDDYSNTQRLIIK